jgi:MATE family multidrug resistance protein
LAVPIFRSLGHEPRLVRLEAVYLQISVGLAVVKLTSTAIGQFMLAINRPGSVLFAAVVGVSANAVAAWALIFGKLGAPPLGVMGAAWAQNIGVTVELLVLVWLVTRPHVRQRFNVSDWRLRGEQMRTLVRLGFPSGLQVLTDVLAWSMFQMWVVGVFGTVAMAANTYVFRYMSVSFMPAFGISQAITALVGRYIGMGRPDLAERRAHLGFALSAVYMVACGVVLYLGRHLLIGLFTEDATVLSLGATLLVFAAIYQFFDALYIAYNGALRGAGDTLFPAIATAVLCWGIAVGGGRLVAVYLPALGPLGPWIAAMAYGVTMGVVILARFLRGGWKTIDVEHEPGGAGVPVVISRASPDAATADAE